MAERREVWSVPVSTVFPLVLSYYKQEKDNINLKLDYQQRIQLLAYFKQEKLGSFTPDIDVETGYFDVVGSDRRKAWMALGEMTKETSQLEIIKLLEAADSNIKETVLKQWQAKQSSEDKEDTREVKVQKNVLQNGIESKESKTEDLTKSPHINGTGKEHRTMHQTIPGHSSPPTVHHPPTTTRQQNELDSNVLAPAALWCSPRAAKQFISQLSAASSTGRPENQLLLTPGEIVDVQVPTSTQASAVFFEFVTERGDIGFGLTFQRRSDTPSHVWPVQELLPVTKRNCSVDLILGNHRYEHQGTYTLKFDNSHSPTEPRVVFYKVFYQNTTH